MLRDEAAVASPASERLLVSRCPGLLTAYDGVGGGRVEACSFAVGHAGACSFEARGVFSRENDREEERVHDSQVSDPGVFGRGGAGMAPSVAVRQQSELDVAAGMVEQEVASLEDLLPTLFERYAAVMGPVEPVETQPDALRQFASPAADRLAHAAARVASARVILASFREAGQA